MVLEEHNTQIERASHFWLNIWHTLSWKHLLYRYTESYLYIYLSTGLFQDNSKSHVSEYSLTRLDNGVSTLCTRNVHTNYPVLSTRSFKDNSKRYMVNIACWRDCMLFIFHIVITWNAKSMLVVYETYKYGMSVHTREFTVSMRKKCLKKVQI